MCSAFMAYSPLEQWRGVRVTGRRIARDYWAFQRNGQHYDTDWRFRTKDARLKLKRLSPSNLAGLNH